MRLLIRGFVVSAIPSFRLSGRERVLSPVPEKLFTLKNTAKVVCGVLLFSGVAAGAGRLLQIGGAHLLTQYPAHSAVARAAVVAGDHLFLVGKGAFLSIAVPTYTVAWVIPKWVVTVGIPQGTQHAHQYVLIPLYQGTIKVSAFLSKTLTKMAQTIYNHSIEPFGRSVASSAKWIWNTVLIPAADQIARASIGIYHQVVLPLSRMLAKAVKWSLNSILVPLIQKTAEIYRHVVEILGRLMMTVLDWAWMSVLAPLKDGAGKALEMISTHILQPLGELLARAAIGTWRNVITPFVSGIKDAVQAIGTRVLLPFCKMVAGTAKWSWTRAIGPLANGFVKGMELIATRIFQPLGKLMAETAKWSLNSVVVPLAKSVSSGVEVVYHSVLAPVGVGAAETSKWVWNATLVPLVNGVAQTAGILKALVEKVAFTVYGSAILPALQAIGNATAETIGAIREMYAELVRCLVKF